MTDNSLFAERKVDGFKEESPTRAFTSFVEVGAYAIGKGFRPSIAHLATYLDAMRTKAGWKLLQILIGENDPTMIFERDHAVEPGEPIDLMQKRKPFFDTAFGEPYTRSEDDPYSDIYQAIANDTRVRGVGALLGVEQNTLASEFRSITGVRGFRERLCLCPILSRHEPQVVFDAAAKVSREMPYQPEPLHVNTVEEVRKEHLAAVFPPVDDPINPAYYAGTACAEIIEHMPTNVGIPGKYVWRLGEKDEEEQERGKSVWYLKREIVLAEQGSMTRMSFIDGTAQARYERIAQKHIAQALADGKLTEWRATVMRCLVRYTTSRQSTYLHTAIGYLEGPESFDVGNGLAL